VKTGAWNFKPATLSSPQAAQRAADLLQVMHQMGFAMGTSLNKLVDDLLRQGFPGAKGPSVVTCSVCGNLSGSNPCMLHPTGVPRQTSAKAGTARSQVIRCDLCGNPGASHHLAGLILCVGCAPVQSAGPPPKANNPGANVQNIEFRFREVQHPVIGQCLAVAFPYNEQVKDAFKGMFPRGQKKYEWDGTSKAWFCRVDLQTFSVIFRDLQAQLGQAYHLVSRHDPKLAAHIPSPAAPIGGPPPPFPGAAAAPQAPQPDAQFFRRKYATADDWKALWLVEGAPPEVVKAVYRALALVHHPDRGGQPGALQKVTVAYQRLEQAGATGKAAS
jgi:hypothetical protein